MAIVKCNKCNRNISTQSIHCPGCGTPVITSAPKVGSFNLRLASKPIYLAYGAVAFLIIGLGTFTTQWLFGSSPVKTVDAFVTALSKEDEETASKHWCFQSGSSLYAVRSWKTIRQEQKKVLSNENELLTYVPHMKDKLKTLSRIKYTEVVSQIESSNKGGISITANWNFKVLKTKDIDRYSEEVKEVTEELNKNDPDLDSLGTEELIEHIKLLRARSAFFIDTLTFSSDKEKITSKTYCIVSLKEQ